MIGVGYVSFLLSQRFKSTPLATVSACVFFGELKFIQTKKKLTIFQLKKVVESTIYPVANIAYPAVTICNYNRVNWNRVDEAKQK